MTLHRLPAIPFYLDCFLVSKKANLNSGINLYLENDQNVDDQDYKT